MNSADAIAVALDYLRSINNKDRIDKTAAFSIICEGRLYWHVMLRFAEEKGFRDSPDRIAMIVDSVTKETSDFSSFPCRMQVLEKLKEIVFERSGRKLEIGENKNGPETI